MGSRFNLEHDFNFSYTPVLGWSSSRYDIFQTCKRMYYYHYYSKYDPEYSTGRIKELKELTSVPLIIGNIVHEVIRELLERLLTTEREINRFKFFYFARKKTEELCNKSNFYEIYYNQLTSIDIDDIFGEVRTCLANFLDSGRFHWIMAKAVSNKDEWLIEPPGYGETRFKDMKAYAKVDFLFPVDDRLVIMDWKTGQPREKKHQKQLKGYIVWAAYHYQINPGEIDAIIAYLKPDYTEVKIPTGQLNLQEFYQRVWSETREMYQFCRDVEENIPLEKNKFLKTNNQKICNYCNFQELCR